MKIHKENIIKICNWKHPDFGTFASFLDGLGNGDCIEIPEPQTMDLCPKCLDKGMISNRYIGICYVCIALEKNKSVQLLNHTHT